MGGSSRLQERHRTHSAQRPERHQSSPRDRPQALTGRGGSAAAAGRLKQPAPRWLDLHPRPALRHLAAGPAAAHRVTRLVQLAVLLLPLEAAPPRSQVLQSGLAVATAVGSRVATAAARQPPAVHTLRPAAIAPLLLRQGRRRQRCRIPGARDCSLELRTGAAHCSRCRCLLLVILGICCGRLPAAEPGETAAGGGRRAGAPASAWGRQQVPAPRQRPAAAAPALARQPRPAAAPSAMASRRRRQAAERRAAAAAAVAEAAWTLAALGAVQHRVPRPFLTAGASRRGGSGRCKVDQGRAFLPAVSLQKQMSVRAVEAVKRY